MRAHKYERVRGKQKKEYVPSFTRRATDIIPARRQSASFSWQSLNQRLTVNLASPERGKIAHVGELGRRLQIHRLDMHRHLRTLLGVIQERNAHRKTETLREK